jgi:hypothetical protein
MMKIDNASFPYDKLVATDISCSAEHVFTISSIVNRPAKSSHEAHRHPLIEILLPKSDCQIIPAFKKSEGRSHSQSGTELTSGGKIAHEWLLAHYDSHRHTRYRHSDHPMAIDPGKCWILLSGPLGNTVTKEILGYTGKGNNLQLSRAAFLPYEQVENEDACRSTTKRYDNGELQENPNWYLRTADGFDLIPEVDERGYARSEFLLVTHLIDVTSTGRRVTIFSGTQGLGTASTGRVLAQKNLLDDAMHSADLSAANFQCLFKLSEFEHRAESRTTEVRRIEHVATQVFSVPDEFWHMSEPKNTHNGRHAPLT